MCILQYVIYLHSGVVVLFTIDLWLIGRGSMSGLGICACLLYVKFIWCSRFSIASMVQLEGATSALGICAFFYM